MGQRENGDICVMMNFYYVFPLICMKRIIRSQRVRFHMRCEKFPENCSRKNTNSRYHLQDLGLDERVYIK